MKKLLVVIPARGGSVGVKRKNVKPLNGKPLISYPIEKALRLKQDKRVEKVIVSTDDSEIADVAKAMGAEVPYVRPPHLADSRALLVDVIKHAFDFFEERGEVFDGILSIHPTVPFTPLKVLESMIEKFEEGAESVASATRVTHGHPYICHLLRGEQNDEAVPFLDLPKNVPRYPRTVRPDVYYFNGAAFLRARSLLLEHDVATNDLGLRPRVVIMEPEESINIDSHFDFKLANLLAMEAENNQL